MYRIDLDLALCTELYLFFTCKRILMLLCLHDITTGEFSPENCSVVMDLNLAELLHQKWKETIQVTNIASDGF